jgi:D-alanyl-D-alanine carboxypeptidase
LSASTLLIVGLLAQVALLATSLAAQAAQRPSEAQLQVWVDEASVGLDSHATQALTQIVGADRRLLAVRAYLRAGDALPQRWSWSAQRLADYAATPEGRAANADIDAVAAAFAAANPGFTLEINRQPRSLELQLAHWNQNASVKAVAASLIASLEGRFGGSTRNPTADELRAALIAWAPPVAATLAAPGLSAHGQGRAFDFQVLHQGRVTAGLDAAAAHQQWDAAGWTQKLHQAMEAAHGRFTGPLQSPYEPWHYAYSP